MSQAELLFTYAGLALQICLLVALMRAGRYRTFPAFFSLTVFTLASTIALLAVRGSAVAYLWVYWISEALNALIVFLALHEIFRTVFFNFYRIAWFRLLFPGIGILTAIVAVVRSILRPMPTGSRVFATIVSLEIGIGFLQMGIFGLFIVLARFFRVRYQQHAFGLALGFGVVSAGSLTVYLLRSEFGTKFDYVVRIAPAIAYTLGLVVWLVTFLVKEPTTAQPSVTTGLTPEQMLSDVRRYTEAAKRIFRR